MNSYYAPLENEGLLHIKGPDSLIFLQGQTTCDTRRVTAAQAVTGIYCTIKGRVVCDFVLTEIAAEHYVLRLRRDILAPSAATLAKYIIFSKASLDPEREDWQTFACWGADAKSTLESIFGDAPATPYGRVSGDGYVLIQIDSLGCQFECYLDTENHPSLATRLGDSFLSATEQAWQALQIEAGVARIEAATGEEFIPQMLNYDLSGHISFDKGCYTGQEVVARMHYRGTPKRRLHRTALPTLERAKAGDLLYSPGSTQSTGTVVNSVTVDGRSTALVVATISRAEEGFHLNSATGALLQCTPVNAQEFSSDEA